MIPLRLVQTRTVFTDLQDTVLDLDYVSIHHRTETLAGLGDPQLLVHRSGRLLGLLVGARAGLSFPLGLIHEDPLRLGALGLPHDHVQLGDGTFDPVIGADASRAVGPVTVAGFAQAQVPLYEGRAGHRGGAQLVGGLSAQAAAGPVQLRLGAIVAHEGVERWHGVTAADDGNLGRTDFYLAPGVTLPLGDWSASLELRTRVFGVVTGAQLSLPLVAQLSVGKLFHFSPGEDDDEVATPELDVAELVTGGEERPLAGVPGKWTAIDFWAPWCEACHVLDAKLRALAARLPLAVRRVNIVDFESPIARRELPSVSVLPHLRLLDPGGAIAFEASGTPAALEAAIEARLR